MHDFMHARTVAYPLRSESGFTLTTRAGNEDDQDLTCGEETPSVACGAGNDCGCGASPHDPLSCCGGAMTAMPNVSCCSAGLVASILARGRSSTQLELHDLSTRGVNKGRAWEVGELPVSVFVLGRAGLETDALLANLIGLGVR